MLDFIIYFSGVIVSVIAIFISNKTEKKDGLKISIGLTTILSLFSWAFLFVCFGAYFVHYFIRFFVSFFDYINDSKLNNKFQG